MADGGFAAQHALQEELAKCRQHLAAASTTKRVELSRQSRQWLAEAASLVAKTAEQLKQLEQLPDTVAYKIQLCRKRCRKEGITPAELLPKKGLAIKGRIKPVGSYKEIGKDKPAELNPCFEILFIVSNDATSVDN